MFWRMDATCISVRGEWLSLVRAVDRDGQTLGFMLSEKRDTKAAKTFFANALSRNSIAKRINIDTVRSKNLHNMIAQNYQFIKRVTRPVRGFKCFASVAATLAGSEVAHMIRKCQFGAQSCGVRQFAPVAG